MFRKSSQAMVMVNMKTEKNIIQFGLGMAGYPLQYSCPRGRGIAFKGKGSGQQGNLGELPLAGRSDPLDLARVSHVPRPRPRVKSGCGESVTSWACWCCGLGLFRIEHGI